MTQPETKFETWFITLLDKHEKTWFGKLVIKPILFVFMVVVMTVFFLYLLPRGKRSD